LKKRNKREPKQKKCERDEKRGRTKDRNICRQSDFADFKSRLSEENHHVNGKESF